MKLPKIPHPALFALGMTLSVSAASIYFVLGYSSLVFLAWLTGPILAAAGLYTKTRPDTPWSRQDTIIITLLILSFVPLYLYSLYNLPRQVNTDEITIMLFQKQLSSTPFTDWLGQSSYFGFPTLIFVVFGKLGQLIGGINLLNMRAVHAFSGLTIVATAYLLFRQQLSRPWAAVATIVLGVNHSLFMISRMAMRDNTGLLLELLALTFLYRGFTSSSHFYAFLGGIVSGLTFYTYYPARIAIVIWTAFLTCWYLVTRRNHPPHPRIKLRITYQSLFATIAFLLVSCPILISAFRQPPAANDYARQQVLIFPEGRQLQQTWVNAPTASAGWIHNIKNGLTTFNNHLHDHGYIYPNYRHGFLDPLTGALLWLGLLIVLIRLARSSAREPADLLVAIGFIGLWLVSSLLLTKAPNYTRLLVVLPFVAYLVAIAIQFIVKQSRLLPARPQKLVAASLAAALVILITFWNLRIAGDFIHTGQLTGNSVGDTARYVELRRDINPYHFYLAASSDYPYYDWGVSSQWQDWLGFFASPSHKVTVLDPAILPLLQFQRPSTVFMNQTLWSQNQQTLLQHYPDINQINITPDGRLMALEIP